MPGEDVQGCSIRPHVRSDVVGENPGRYQSVFALVGCAKTENAGPNLSGSSNPIASGPLSAEVVALDQVYYYNRFEHLIRSASCSRWRRDVVHADEGRPSQWRPDNRSDEQEKAITLQHGPPISAWLGM